MKPEAVVQGSLPWNQKSERGLLKSVQFTDELI